MERPVVHFEIIGSDPARLRGYYGDLFGWEFHTGDAATEAVSAPGAYGFVPGESTRTAGDGTGINGGVGGGEGYEPRVLFYVGVPDVEAAWSASPARRERGRDEVPARPGTTRPRWPATGRPRA
ncbi:VOC family protein [Spirillospora sp. CA-255316]